MTNERYVNVRKNNFTMVGNELLNDSKLTLQAKGLLSIFLSNDTSQFNINMKQIITRSKNGRDAHYKVVNELIEHGYFARVEVRNEMNQFEELVYVFSDNKQDVLDALQKYKTMENVTINADKSKPKKPVTENQDTAKKPLPEIQDTENQDTEIQRPGNQYINNTNPKNTKSNNTKSNNIKSLLEPLGNERILNAVQENLEPLLTRNVDVDTLCKWIVTNIDVVSEDKIIKVIISMATWGEKINNTHKVIGYIVKAKENNGRVEMIPDWLHKEDQENKEEAPQENLSNFISEEELAQLKADLLELSGNSRH